MIEVAGYLHWVPAKFENPEDISLHGRLCGSRKYPYHPMEIPRNWGGLKEVNFQGGGGCTNIFLSIWFEMQSNVHYFTFPINWGNQTNSNIPSVEINVWCHTFCPDIEWHRWHSWTSCSLDVKMIKMLKKRTNNTWTMTLYTLKTVLSSIIHAVKWNSYSVYIYFIWYLYKIIPFETSDSGWN